MKSLSSVSTVYRGKDGEAGSSKNRFGRNASPTFITVSVPHKRARGLPAALACLTRLFLQVPLGTVVKDEGEMLADLSRHDQLYTVAYGGAGGKGNRFFLSNENRAPMTATPGEKGQERVVRLELRTMAHAALVRASLHTHLYMSVCTP